MRFSLGVVAAPAVACMVLLFPTTTMNAGRPTATTTALSSDIMKQRAGSLPLAFTKNQGQWDEKVLFRASAGGTTLWFCRDGITYQFVHRVPQAKSVGRVPFAAGMIPHEPSARTEPDSIETVVVHAAFGRVDPTAKLVGEGLLEYRCNYFLGNEPAKWRTNVPNYAAVVYRNVYPGVDVRYEGKGGDLACSYSAASESDLARVKFRYEGNATVTETGPGQFRVEAPWGQVFEPMSTNPPGEVFGRPTASEAAGIASVVSLAYSTYLGGGSDDYGSRIAVDGSGNAYVTGGTYSVDFPTVAPYQTEQSGQDAFVTKLNEAGNALVYSTYLGGGGDEWGGDISVDGSGNAYFTGGTSSTDFPTAGPYQTTYGGGTYDGFVTKLSGTGNALVYSTYLGGSGYEEGRGVAVDGGRNVYVTGTTNSPDFPTVLPYQTARGGEDAFVTKLNASGNTLVYSTYLGGGSGDFAYDIAVDADGNAYVTGGTVSADFPIIGPCQIGPGGREDVYVTKLNAPGNALMYSTRMGGGEDDWARGIAIDGSGSAYVTGGTFSTDFPTAGPYRMNHGSEDVFVIKLDAAGCTQVYGTYLGGGDQDQGLGIAVDGSGKAYVTGIAYSYEGFPTVGRYQIGPGGHEDGFVTILNVTGDSLVYSSRLGGDAYDAGQGLAVDGSGNCYITGATNSADFPTIGPYQTDQGLMDAFVVKIEWQCSCLSQGDIDGDGSIDVNDVIAEINIAFINGADVQDSSCPKTRGDVNNDGVVNVNDVIHMIKTVFTHGPAPVDPCGP